MAAGRHIAVQLRLLWRSARATHEDCLYVADFDLDQDTLAGCDLAPLRAAAIGEEIDYGVPTGLTLGQGTKRSPCGCRCSTRGHPASKSVCRSIRLAFWLAAVKLKRKMCPLRCLRRHGLTLGMTKRMIVSFMPDRGWLSISIAMP